MFVGTKIKVPARRFCNRCGSRVYHSDVRGYPFVCFTCDENMYKFETHHKRK